MKKTILITNILFGALLLGTGCKKTFLDRVPQDQVSSSTFWTSANDVQLAANGCYDIISTVTYDSWYYDGFADNVYAQYPWESSATNISAGNITANLDAGYNYEDIRRTNYFLEHVSSVAMDATLKKRYIAEVRFLRAYKYFFMTELFGDLPLVTSASPTDAELTPIPKSDVLTFIIKELKEASVDLPQQYAGGSGQETGRVTKGAALALLSRVYLFNSQWTEAAQSASQVMGMGYVLFNTATVTAADMLDDYSNLVTFANADDKSKFYQGLRNYEQLFWKANQGNSEFILESQFLENSAYDRSSGINTLLLPSEANGWSSITPTLGLVNSYWNRDGSTFTPPSNATRATNYGDGSNIGSAYLTEFKNRDTRLYASILFPTNPWNSIAAGYSFAWGKGGSNNSKTGYNFRKLVDPAYTLESNAPQSYPLIRYAEILLNYAEAKNETSGPDATIYDALDLIRNRVSMPKIARTQSQASLRTLIRNERRIELAEEGFRYFDIRRWNISDQVMKDEYDIVNTLVQKRIWDNKFKLLPYPQTAVDRNPKLTAAQKAKGY